MLRNYFAAIVQNLLINKAYAFINIFGLATGLAVCIIILQYVRFEQGYDTFHPNYTNKYRAYLDFDKGAGVNARDAANFAPAGPALMQDFAEVKSYVRITPEYSRVVLRHDQKTFEEPKVYYVDSTFFSFFGYTLLMGDSKTVLKDVGSVVLSLSSAERYFGPRATWQQSPISKTILFNNKTPLIVTGIMADFPAQSHFQSSALISFATFAGKNDVLNQWGWNDFYTYIELADGASPQALQAKLPAFLAKYQKAPKGNRMLLQPLHDIHLHSQLAFELGVNGSAQTVYFLSVIAIIILIIAWVNYINLATARAELRAKEIGVRKISGASRSQVMVQFMLEAFVMNFMALALALAIVTAAAPLLQALMGKPLPISLWNDRIFLLYSLILYVAGSLLSGIYPAIVLSSFKPIATLKSSTGNRAHGKSLLRQALVMFQFIVSAGLISGTILIGNQMAFVRTKDLGFRYANTVVINAPSTQANDSVFLSMYETFKNNIRTYPGVEGVTVSSALPGKSYNDLDGQGGIRMTYDASDISHSLSSYRVDEAFVDVYGLKVIAGRKFSEHDRHRNDVVLVNRKGAELLGFADPADIIGKKIIYNNDDGNIKEIIGVIENYHHKSLKANFEPTILRSRITYMLYISVRLSNTANAQQTLAAIGEQWKALFPADPFQYSFLEDHVQDQYKADIQFSRIFSAFSIFSIAIACLGLSGLVSFSITVRMKEIGVRKVLGASVAGIVLLFTKSYARLLLMAFVVGIPLSFYILNLWMNNFAQKAAMPVWLFFIPAVLVSALALATVCLHVVRAALANPVDSLRNE